MEDHSPESSLEPYFLLYVIYVLRIFYVHISFSKLLKKISVDTVDCLHLTWHEYRQNKSEVLYDLTQ